MDERHEELAALNALGMLESDEKRVLTGISLADKELRDLSAELELIAAELGCLVTPVEPPAELKRRIRAKIRAQSGSKWRSISIGVVIGTLGWVAAAALGVASVWLWQDRQKLTDQVAAVSRLITPPAELEDGKAKARSLEEELKKRQQDFESQKTAFATQVETLRKSESDAKARIEQLLAEAKAQKEREATLQMQVVTVQSEVWEYRRAIMTVIWDGSRHQGVLLLDKMPRAESGTDYQLWVVDPAKTAPVSAGVVAVDDKGVAKLNFRPVEDVGDGVKFVISVEKKGGVPQKEGPTVIGP